ncbi:MAG: selenocysteine-specific translation elongation factor [Proteobacteria bacterium]|nr:selenocysteine-specific translation elongation factor [Pseudomonadota bacterium]MBI3499953.1 selenocysteine-specific translation elongation factor [Pseudomonadota bacterium]
MIVGTAGHIDHGKTALIKALTGIDADRLPEEKARGITIDLGFAYRPIAGGETLGFVDVPGHERFVHNMLAGATGIDFALLVVAADDGPMPQTREHLAILDLLGVRQGVVALSKADLVGPDRLLEVSEELNALLEGTLLAGVKILPISALSGDGVPALERLLLDAAASLPERQAGGRFRLAIDRSFSLTGAGTVVTGTVASGRVKVGDRLLISPSGIEARVRGIHAQNREAKEGHVGQRCAVNLTGTGVDREKIHRGDWLVDPALHTPTDRIDARLRLLASEDRPLRHWTPVHLHLGAAHLPARVAILEGETVAPGEEASVQLVLDRPIGALTGDRFILRDQSARRTIGGGRILDPFPPSRGRRRPERLAALAALAEAEPESALARLIEIEPGWVDLARFALSFNLGDAEALWRKLGLVIIADGRQRFGLSRSRTASLGSELKQALAAYHAKTPDSPGLELERLRLALARRLPPAVFAALAASLLAEKAIEADGPWLRMPGHAVKLTPADQKLWARIEPTLARERFQPPRVRDFAQSLGQREEDVRKLLKRLARMGKLIEVAHDHFFLRSNVAALLAIAGELSRPGTFTAAQFRDRISTGRKLAIQILEFFDRTGVTLRDGDLRRLRADRLHHFGTGGG